MLFCESVRHLNICDGLSCINCTIFIFFFLTFCTEVIQVEKCSANKRVEIVSRADWNARPSKVVLPSLSKPVSMVFIHHTAGPSCTTKDECIKRVKQIQNFHMDDRSFSDIGYNYLVGEDGRGYEGRGLDKVGAHTYHYNDKAIAISVMGNYSKRTPTAEALRAIKAIINCAINAGVVASNYKLYGHRDAGCTGCPGDKLYEEIKTWPKYSTFRIQKYCNTKPVN